MNKYAEVARTRVLVPLTSHLHYKPKAQVQRRYEAMGRELAYMQQMERSELPMLSKNGWSEQRLHVLFALNSFYQCYLAPLHASASRNASSVGRNVAIVHGSLNFDKRHAREVNDAADDLFSIARSLGIEGVWLALNTCNDVIYQLANRLREEGKLRDG